MQWPGRAGTKPYCMLNCVAARNCCGPHLRVVCQHHLARSAEADLTRREIVDLDIRSGGLLSLTRQGPPQVGAC